MDKYEVLTLNIEDIYCDAQFNCRGPIDSTACVNLASDIRANGLDTPIMVRPYKRKEGKKYQIVSGHRRFTAFLINGSTTIPAFIRLDLEDDYVASAANLRENIQRENISFLDESRRVGYLIGAGYSPKQVADMVGKTSGWIEPRKQLMVLPQVVHEAADKGVVNQSHIGQLYALRNDKEKFNQLLRDIQTQHENGNKVIQIRQPMTNKRLDALKKPTSAEMETMRELMYNQITSYCKTHYTPNIVLSWVMGDVTMREVFLALKDDAAAIGRVFNPPADVKELL